MMPHEKMAWALLFDNDLYIVTEVEYVIEVKHSSGIVLSLKKFGIEICDKQAERSIFLANDLAGSFVGNHVIPWRSKPPEEAFVNEVLAGYLSCANLPLCLH